MKHLFRWPQLCLYGLLTAALPLALVAQEDEEEVYELSPFTIAEDEDVGYLATTTLAGTRLNTPLRDVGSAISILTEELFDDTGAVDAATILSYAPNTEVGGVQGNFAGNQFNGSRPGLTQQRVNPQGGQRIRGLVSATLTRNYFLTDIPFDSYNSTRVTINRGPNSLLFGIGSPGGVINNGSKGALMGQNFGEVSARIGEHSSHRETFDYNAELIEGRLALRVSGLHDDTQYQQRPSFDIDKRIYAALEAVLFKNEASDFLGATTLRGSFESGDIHGTPPSVIPPADVLSEWFSPGFHGLENVEGIDLPDWATTYPAKYTFDDREGGNSQFYNNAPTWGLWQKQVALVYNQPNAQSPSVGLADSSIEGLMARIEYNTATTGPNVGRGQFNMHRTESIFFAPFVTGFTVPVIMDRNIFDNENVMIGGRTNWATQDFDASNFALEQILLEGDAGFEIVYDEQRYRRAWSLPFTQAGRQHGADVVFDISEYIGTGEPNPNLGRPVIIDESFGTHDEFSTDREAFRATAFYSIDFKEKTDNLGWLGRHVFTGLYSDLKVDTLTRNIKTGWISDKTDIATDTGTAPIHTFFRRAVTAVYVGDSALNAQSVSDVRISPVSVPVAKDGDVHKVLYYDRAAGIMKVTDDYTIRKYLRAGDRNRQEIESEVFSWQSYFLDDHLVGLAGWRSDTSTAFGRAGSVRLPNGTWDEDNLLLKSDPDSEVSGDTFTWSVVGHVPIELPGGTRLSVHYGESENFSAVGIRRNPYNEVLAPPNGTTEEYGFTLAMLDNKLSMKFNWFETNSAGADAGLGGAVGTAVNTVGRWLLGWRVYDNQGLPIEDALEYAGRIAGTDASGWGTYQEAYDEIIGLVPDRLQSIRNFRVVDGEVESEAGGTGATTDFVAEGFEFEMIGNITQNWRVFLNIAKQETVQDNTAPALKEIVGAYQANLGASPIQNWGADPDNQSPLSFQGFFDLRAATPLAAALAKDGTLNQELRKWRGNLITTYDFSEGMLKGFFAGGGIRWQDGVATGYPLIANAEGVRIPDIGRPFIGPSELNGDLWIGYSRKLTDKIDWKIQLNGRNIFGDSDPITVVTNPDGRVAVIRNPLPTEVFLTNTFRF